MTRVTPDGDEHQMLLWQTATVLFLFLSMVGLTLWLAFGHDVVKHSEMDAILAARAPYCTDRNRVQENLDHLHELAHEQKRELERLHQEVGRLRRRIETQERRPVPAKEAKDR